jgi:hypothetical protein
MAEAVVLATAGVMAGGGGHRAEAVVPARAVVGESQERAEDRKQRG